MREVAYSRLRKLEQWLFVKKTDPQACCGLGLRGATKTHSGRNLLSIKRLCSKRGIGRSTSVGLFSSSEPDKVQRVIPQRAAAEATARQRRPGQRPSLTGAALAAARKAMTRLPVGSLRPEPHCHLVGAGLGSSFTHLIREASLACGAGKISIGARVRCGRDHNSIAVDVDIV